MSHTEVPAIRLAALGLALWGGGLAAVHFASPLGVFGPALAAPLLLATLPLAWGTVRLAQRVTGLGSAHLMESVAVAVLPAALLDGAALTWMPGLYAADVAGQRAVAAWLLWFLGASFAIAVAMSQQKPVIE